MRGVHYKGMRGKSNVITKLLQKECLKSLGCALYIRCALSFEKYGRLSHDKNSKFMFNLLPTTWGLQETE